MGFINLVYRVREMLTISNLVKTFRIIYKLFLDWFIKKPSEGEPCFEHCFLNFSITKGCHIVFILAIGLSTMTIILNESGPPHLQESEARITIYYFELALSIIVVFADFIFIFSYFSRKAILSLITFYSFLLAGVFHLLFFFFGNAPFDSNKIRLVHTLASAVFFYMACITINYIQKDTLAKKLREEQLCGLEMWVDWEIGDMLKIEPNRGKCGLAHLVVDHHPHHHDRKDAAQLNRACLFR